MATKAAGSRGISDDRILEQTGKRSAEWYALLDAWDGPAKGHTAMARYLRDELGIPGWWAQNVTVRYEWERGMRVEAVVPEDLVAALEAQPEARARYEALAATHRHEYIRWITEAKRPETRARRVAETVERVMAGTPGPK